jgi:hypothetical protein
MQLSSGELNTKMIERELVTAIAEDHTYKVTDDAKKRHIATAASYDEFRNFVACAEQTRVRLGCHVFFPSHNLFGKISDLVP